MAKTRKAPAGSKAPFREKQYKEVTITVVQNGWVVCEAFKPTQDPYVFTDWETMSAHLFCRMMTLQKRGE